MRICTVILHKLFDISQNFVLDSNKIEYYQQAPRTNVLKRQHTVGRY